MFNEGQKMFTEANTSDLAYMEASSVDYANTERDHFTFLDYKRSGSKDVKAKKRIQEKYNLPEIERHNEFGFEINYMKGAKNSIVRFWRAFRMGIDATLDSMGSGFWYSRHNNGKGDGYRTRGFFTWFRAVGETALGPLTSMFKGLTITRIFYAIPYYAGVGVGITLGLVAKTGRFAQYVLSSHIWRDLNLVRLMGLTSDQLEEY